MRNMRACCLVLAASVTWACQQTKVSSLELAGEEARYCTMCARVETAATFCRPGANGGSVCLVERGGKANSAYCRISAGVAGGPTAARHCPLEGASEGGVQCEVRGAGGRPASEYSMSYCLN